MIAVVILASFNENVVVAETNYQIMLKVIGESLLKLPDEDNSANFSGESKLQ